MNSFKSLKEFVLKQVAQKQLQAPEGQKYLEEIMSLEKGSLSQEEIAIVGMACRFPKASSPIEFWSNLSQGIDAAGIFPKSRKEDVLYANEKIWEEYRDVKTRPGCFLDRIDLFDAEFFGISPAEAKVMAPSQRLFLEVSWEAIENAGFKRKDIEGSETGVYVGYSASWGYEKLVPADDPNIEIGNTPAMIPSRLNYVFNLKGPSLLIDTTCSSSLVALHAACQALRNKDCKQAIVGGISVILLPIWNELAAMGNEASDGRCKAFDAAADGTNVAEGLGVIMIKPLSQALADGNFIHGIIKGSAINSDAKSNGLTAPNPQAQTEVICRAWNNANINPALLSYIEAHGTGTKLGDPIEITALSSAFKKYTSETGWCPLGSVKSNIGHLDAAAGIASLIKVLLSMRYGQIPPSLHFHQPNPYIDFNNSAVFVNSQIRPWERRGNIRLAGISAFGITGTNAHVVLAEGPQEALPSTSAQDEEMFCLSARSEEGLWKLIQMYAKELGKKQTASIEDICYTLNVGRDHYPYRIGLLVKSYDQLQSILQTCASSKSALFQKEIIHYSFVPPTAVPPTAQPAEFKHSISLLKAQDILEAYIKGENPDYNNYYAGKKRKLVPLPNTPLESQRYWPVLRVSSEPKNEVINADSYLFDLNWVPQKRHVNENMEALSLSGIWLVFALPSSLCDQLVKRLKSEGCEVFCLYSGPSFSVLKENSFTINPFSFRDYNQVLEVVGFEKLKKLSGIIHAWNCQASEDAMSSLDKLTLSPFEGSYGVFHLIKLLKEYGLNQNIQMTVLTSLAHKVNSSDLNIYPNRAVLVGLNKVITQELPKIATYCLDIDLENMPEEQVVYEIFQELTQPIKARDDLVAYRKGVRYLQYLCQMTPEKKGEKEIETKEGDVYLFAGGGGYLGIQTCLSLARKQKKLKFVLLNRSDLPPRSEWEKLISTLPPASRVLYQIQGIKAIERLGSEVIWKQVDVTDEAKMRIIVDEIRKIYDHIDGVIVAMKHINVKTIEDMSMEEYQAAILSKLRGTWLLDQLTRQDALRFFITFSSISSIMGGPVNSDCTSVNTFLDAFGEWRNSQGRLTITLNLTEILTEDKKGTEHKITMLPPISYQEFLDCVDRVLQRGLSFAVIAAFDYKIMKVVLPRIKIRFSSELLQAIQAATNLNNANSIQDLILSKEQVSAKLTEIWKEVLGHENLSADADFFDYGGSSLSALKLLRLIEANLGAKFEVADLYTYSTINQMHERICEIKGITLNDPLMSLLENFENDQISLEEITTVLESQE